MELLYYYFCTWQWWWLQSFFCALALSKIVVSRNITYPEKDPLCLYNCNIKHESHYCKIQDSTNCTWPGFGNVFRPYNTENPGGGETFFSLMLVRLKPNISNMAWIGLGPLKASEFTIMTFQEERAQHTTSRYSFNFHDLSTSIS